MSVSCLFIDKPELFANAYYGSESGCVALWNAHGLKPGELRRARIVIEGRKN